MAVDTYTISASGKASIIKSPQAVLDYSRDLADWLTDVEDTLQTLVVTADAGVTVDSSSIIGTKVVAWISGGTVGETYRVKFVFTTAGGRTDARSVYLKIRER